MKPNKSKARHNVFGSLVSIYVRLKTADVKEDKVVTSELLSGKRFNINE